MPGRLASIAGTGRAVRHDLAIPLLAALVVAAGVVLGAGTVTTGLATIDQPAPSTARLGFAVAVVLAAQLARLQLRVDGGAIWVAWGEAAVIVLCTALPAAWVPAAVALGSGLAQIVLSVKEPRRGPGAMVVNAGSLTLASAVAVTLANLVTTTYRAPFTVATVVALALGALGYMATGASLIASRVAARQQTSFPRVLRITLGNKLPMFFGNIAVGLIVVALLHQHELWLVLLPPGLWLMHQVYAFRMRSNDERRTWQAFAEATRELNRLDERDAAVAGVLGALRLFPAHHAQLIVINPDGSATGYSAPAGGPVTTCPVDELAAGTHVAARTLYVGPVRVGELRLGLRPPGTLRHRDLLMYAAYGDALAAALHDAATHHELREMTERSSQEALQDPLTGLLNRAGLLARGDEALRELRHDDPIGLLLLDIDHFKEVNDTLGHSAGDEVLQTSARRLTAALDDGEFAARLGGDEFAVLLTALPPEIGLRSAGSPARVTPMPLAGARASADTASTGGARTGATGSVPLTHASARARVIAEALAAPSEVARVQVSVEASVGVAVARAGLVDASELLRRADVAMYQAKRGGSSVSWYDPALDEASTDRLALLAEMREALKRQDQLVLVLQPAVALDGPGALAAEALVRWQHPRRGLLMPAEFVSTVENSELIGPFTRYVLDHALALAARWAADGVDIPIAVNLSARSMLDRRLPRDVASLLNKHAVRPDRLILEITENAVMHDLKVVDDVLSRLRQYGVQLAVDDFGTGYSSLTFLTRVPVDEVKIDGSFVRRMIESPEAAAIVRATIDLGRRLGVRVVAEGVETAEQRATLTSLGCTGAQGFLFHPPMPGDAALEVLRDLGRASQAPVLRLTDGAS